MAVEFLVTHSGGFHADELLSSVILTRLYPGAQIVRSRTQGWITPSQDRIIYDVGGAYDAEAQIFDHHQRGAPLRQNGQPYSSFGLVWKHYGRDYLTALGIPAADIEDVHASFDKSFVLTDRPHRQWGAESCHCRRTRGPYPAVIARNAEAFVRQT